MTAKRSNLLMNEGKTWDRPKVMNLICDALATSSRGIGKILIAITDEYGGAPSYSTVMLWMVEEPELSEKYARAKEAQADFMADELIEIADDGSNDYMESNSPDNPGYKLNGEHVTRSRLRVDARKWVASKLKPKKYGDKLTQELTGKDGEPLFPAKIERTIVDPSNDKD